MPPLTFLHVAVAVLILCISLPVSAVVPSISASDSATCIVTSAGTVRCWGASPFGFAYASTAGDAVGAAVDFDLGGPVEQISVSSTLGCALLLTGTVKCWGLNTSGVFADPAAYQYYTPMAIGGVADAVAIHTSYGAACAILAGGSLVCWGNNQFGQLGDGTRIDRATPIMVQGLPAAVTHVHVGRTHTCARLATEVVRCWGQGANMDSSTSARDVFPAGLTTGRLFGTYWMTCSSTFNAGTICLNDVLGTFVPINGANDAIDFTATIYGTMCMIDIANRVKCTGVNDQGQLGIGGPSSSSETWTHVTALGSSAVRLAAGGNHFCALLIGGGVKCWGNGAYQQLGLGTERAVYSHPTSPESLAISPVTISMGVDNACGTAIDGVTQCWGRNTDGQLGDGTQVNRWLPNATVPVAVKLPGVATSYEHSCAVSVAGEVACWGRNAQGAIGPNAASDAVVLAPLAVNGLPTAAATLVRVGSGFSCAIVSGEVWCWGGNSSGALGRATSQEYGSPPGKVSGLPAGVTDLSLGNSHACAVANGGVWCWGAGGGRIGDGSLENRFVATSVLGLSSGVLRVSAGGYHSCALLSSGSVRCWGINWSGQIGNGTVSDAPAPIEVNLDGFAIDTLVAGGGQTCVVTVSGALKCWGAMLQPDGSKVWQIFAAPTDVYEHGSDVQLLAIDVGGSAFCALKASQGFRCWGGNLYGGIGAGTAGYRPIPNRFVPDVNAWGKASISVLPATFAVGDAIGLQMMVPGPMPTGTVRFERNNQTIAACASVPILQGIATCNLTIDASGPVSFRANFDGDISYPPSSATATGTATGPISITMTGWSFNLLASHTLLTLGRPTFVGAVNPAQTGTIRLTFPGQSCTLYLSLANPTCLISAFPSGLNQLLLAEYSGDENYRATTQEYRLNIVAGLDVNADGVVDSTDWLWVSRYVLGFRGASLSAGLASPNAKRSNPDIENYISANTTLFDIDLDGRVLGGTDMVLFSRFLSGVQGAALTGGAVGTFAFRPSAADIRSYLTYFTR